MEDDAPSRGDASKIGALRQLGQSWGGCSPADTQCHEGNHTFYVTLVPRILPGLPSANPLWLFRQPGFAAPRFNLALHDQLPPSGSGETSRTTLDNKEELKEE